ncbi:MAG: hypothetical protein WD468_02215 [Pirellulales bacterium]
MMRSNRFWIVLGLLIGGAAFWPEAACARDWDAAAIHYGDGVHAYYNGNSSRAEQSLSNAMVMDSQDPRIYYFRALSLLRQGRTAEARGDMLVGATLEARQPNRFAVGAALERVQGCDRLLLEQFRRQARVKAGLNGASGGHVINAGGHEPEVLRQRVVIPLEEYLGPGKPQPASSGATNPAVPRTFAPSDDPFRDDPRAPTSRAPVVPPPPTAPQPPNTDPLDEGDPFGGAATQPTPQGTPTPVPNPTPTEVPAEGNEEDPFGTL